LCVDRTGTSVWVCASGWGSEEEEEVENRVLERALNGKGDCREARGVRGVYLEVGLECKRRESVRRARKGKSFDAIVKFGVYLQKNVRLKLKAVQGGEI
jgi:hypothetical protein